MPNHGLTGCGHPFSITGYHTNSTICWKTPLIIALSDYNSRTSSVTPIVMNCEKPDNMHLVTRFKKNLLE